MIGTRQFLALSLLALVAAVGMITPRLGGDWTEYTVAAIAIASHGSPNVGVADLHAAAEAFPEGRPEYERIAATVRTPDSEPSLWFFRARNGDVYPSHFFAYSALVAAVLPFVVGVGASAAKAFLVVNGLFALFLALALYRLFRSMSVAATCLALFILTGGIGYFQLTSPEFASSAALLAALVLFCADAPILAGLLAGFACMQNPPIALFVAFAPLLRGTMRFEAEKPRLQRLRELFGARDLAGLAIVAACAALPILFNQWAWGVPSIIVKVATSPQYASIGRLFSYFFDLNQGLLIGFPGIALGLLLAVRTLRDAALLGAAALFTLALALPALTTNNWNSGAVGVMRYAFWGGMPLLFALLMLLRRFSRGWRATLAVAIATQAWATYLAAGYDFVHLSPGAELVLRHFPGVYNPEPEIFFERVTHQEKIMENSRVYVFAPDGIPLKVLVHQQHGPIDQDVCGKGRHLSKYTSSEAGSGWRYYNGPFTCENGPGV